MSMESSVYYPWLDDPKFMSAFDVEMTYRLCSQVRGWGHLLIEE